jgi:hypothetical protein
VPFSKSASPYSKAASAFAVYDPHSVPTAGSHKAGDVFLSDIQLRSAIALTRQGMKVIDASRILDITPEYASLSFKRILVNLLAVKLY